MRNRIHLMLALVAAVALVAAPAFAAGTVGEKAPAFSLSDLDGNTHSLADYEGKVVVLEWINPNCPFSDRHAKEETMAGLADKHGEVVWLAINSTAPEHKDFLQKSEHAEWAAERAVDYAILYDESGDVGHAYDAKTTPHMYVIDEAGNIAYNGAIDDDQAGRKEQAERDNYVDGALVAHTAGSSIDPASTRPYGCSVKY
ncbi:MAG TPA: redoxin domain-containing protein [Thermoanaerobaculia bacterium]|nr:redoxin domain-containing protein [Thermoanaerobaculia bacterium]